MGRPLFYLSSAFCSIVIASVLCFFMWRIPSQVLLWLCKKVLDLWGFGRGWAAPFFVGQAGTAAQRPFVLTLLGCCGLVINPSINGANPLLELKESLSVMLFYSFYSFSCPYYHWLLLARSLHLLSHLLFDSWHAECWLTVPLSPKIRKHPSVFILFHNLSSSALPFLPVYSWI